MTAFTPYLIGGAVLAAGAAAAVLAVLSPRGRAAFAYAQLVAMAGMYAGFAIAFMDRAEIVQHGDWSALLLELLVALAFIFAGLAALLSSRPWLLGALILAHGAVNLLHLVLGSGHIPAWYAFTCIIYDAIAGVIAIWFLSERDGGP